jgi:hypothetical protein
MLPRVVICFVAVVMLSSAAACADTLYGTCVYSDGSKVNGTVTISTSWNGKKAFPKKGKYRLDFGGSVGKEITVYVNGDRYATIEVNGDTELNIVVD